MRKNQVQAANRLLKTGITKKRHIKKTVALTKKTAETRLSNWHLVWMGGGCKCLFLRWLEFLFIQARYLLIVLIEV